MNWWREHKNNPTQTTYLGTDHRLSSEKGGAWVKGGGGVRWMCHYKIVSL